MSSCVASGDARADVISYCVAELYEALYHEAAVLPVRRASSGSLLGERVMASARVLNKLTAVHRQITRGLKSDSAARYSDSRAPGRAG